MAAEELALHLPVVIAIVEPGVEDIPVQHFNFISTILNENRTGKLRQWTALRSFFHHSPNLVSSFDGPAGEQGYPGEA